MVDSRSTNQMARDEREEFAALLAGLTPQLWESPTLCELWRVREVAVRTVSYDNLSTAGLVGRFLKGRLSTDRINAIGVADYADRAPERRHRPGLVSRQRPRSPW
jgi:hypothetical protein